MIKKAILILGLGTTLDIASLANFTDTLCKNSTNAACKAGQTVTERGFPFSYLEKAQTQVASEVPQTEFIFSNAILNLVFWCAIATVIVFLLLWLFSKVTKIIFYLALLTIICILGFVFLQPYLT